MQYSWLRLDTQQIKPCYQQTFNEWKGWLVAFFFFFLPWFLIKNLKQGTAAPDTLDFVYLPHAILCGHIGAHQVYRLVKGR